MEEAVDRALRRPGEYFFEDGLWEIVGGLWIGLTVAHPLHIGGVVENWSPVLLLLTGLGLDPAVKAAKSRWVYPRTGRVTYPDPQELPSAHPSLGLSPATRPVVSPVPQSRAARLWAVLWAVAIPVFIVLSMRAAAGLGLSDLPEFGNAASHLAFGAAWAIGLLFAAWRWRQRRWVVLAATMAALAIVVASTGLDKERTLALHAAGIAGALVLSGTAAFVSFIHHAPEPGPTTNGA
jgi:hypothetical protein